MKKAFLLLTALFLLNGCVESVALLGSSVSGASSGKILQSSLNSAISYGVKSKTGKSPMGHMLAYAEEKNPEKKKEPCVSFIESTRSELCTIAKKQIFLTNSAVKEKALKIVKKYPKPNKIKDVISEKDKELISSFFQKSKSPRKPALALQFKIKKRRVLAPIKKIEAID
tara:strand:- start:1256 stop:1765 length:510 start_codon:yes stop_codon:yes gene_type:complete